MIPDKKLILGTTDVHNPRSRSAKLRWAVKTEHKKEAIMPVHIKVQFQDADHSESVAVRRG